LKKREGYAAQFAACFRIKQIKRFRNFYL